MVWTKLLALALQLIGMVTSFLPSIPGQNSASFLSALYAVNGVVDLQAVFAFALPLYTAFTVGMPIAFGVFVYNKVRGN